MEAGKGPYAVLAYCGCLTITRWDTLEEAVKAKRMIDGGGCGGCCARVHLIVYLDPANPAHEHKRRMIEDYAKQHPEAVRELGLKTEI